MEKKEVIETIKYLRKYNTETDRIEVKTASGGFPKKCYDTISSFSNKFGGMIIFGISEDNDFSTEGVYDVKDLQEKISNLCTDSMEPEIRPDILPLDFEGKNIVAVKIDEIPQNSKPCYYKPKGIKDGSYTRVGDKDEIMNDYELYSIYSYRNHIFEDKRLTTSSSIEDLDLDKVKKYVDKLKTEKPNFAKNDLDKCMKLCGIIDTYEGKVYPTLAGTMLFGLYPQSFYPQLFIACVVVPGLILGETGPLGERFIDNKRVEGTIEEMLEGAMNFLVRNMKTSIIIKNGKRINRTEYPLDALREAIANALIHRDYSFQKESVYIAVYMYNDRIEITSPGALYGVNKLEELETDKMMEVRNPIIVGILEENSDVIENRHSGITTMKTKMTEYGLPEPEFYVGRDYFKVIFRNSFDNSNISSGQVGGQVSGQVGGQVGGQKKLSLDDYKEQVLEYCSIPRTAKEISEHLHIKSRQYISTNIIKPLIDEKKIDYTNKKGINASNQKYITVRK